jgi:hypothetical protein
LLALLEWALVLQLQEQCCGVNTAESNQFTVGIVTQQELAKFVKETAMTRPTSMSVVTKRGEKLVPNFGVPLFCPRCEELRNVDPETDATGLNTPHESLTYESFQMCSICYALTKDNPEQVEANKKAYHDRLVIKESKIEAEVKSKRFRVWIKGDYHKYVESIVGKPFFSWTERSGQKCKVLLTEAEAKQMVETITSKNIDCWIEEEEV